MKHLLLLWTVMLCCISCTHNNGDIGLWFGTWKLDEIAVNGTVDEQYADADNIVWKFQSGVVEMQEILPMHMTSDHFGTWREIGDGNIEMSFIYHDDHNPSGYPYYVPPVATHLPQGVFTIVVLRQTSKKMTLQYTDPDSNIYTYYFTKW